MTFVLGQGVGRPVPCPLRISGASSSAGHCDDQNRPEVCAGACERSGVASAGRSGLWASWWGLGGGGGRAV